MIERFRLWLRGWLGISALCMEVDVLRDQHALAISQLRTEVAALKVATYVAPQTPEPERKVIQTRTMREYNAILEKEFEHEEA